MPSTERMWNCRLREVSWYTEALAELGFVDIRVVPGPFDVVVATRA